MYLTMREEKTMDDLEKRTVEGENVTPVTLNDDSEEKGNQVDAENQEVAEVTSEEDGQPQEQEIEKGKLLCPRCGKIFEQKEKSCPYCGLRNNLKVCKSCGATMAKSANKCPNCGTENKKPFYKRGWFWGLGIIALVIVILNLPYKNSDNQIANANQETLDTQTAATGVQKEKQTNSSTDAEEKDIIGSWNAIIYFDREENESTRMENIGYEWKMKFNADHTGVMETTSSSSTDFEWSYYLSTAEGDKLYHLGDTTVSIIGEKSELKEYAGYLLIYTDDAAIIFERDNTGSWIKKSGTTSVTKSKTSSTNMTSSQKNALKKAESYLKYSAFSYSGLIEQLEYEGYSTEDATYAVDHCGADWKEQAVKKAKSYLKYSSFSKSGLIDQLEYEGFTYEQAVYGAEQAY